MSAESWESQVERSFTAFSCPERVRTGRGWGAFNYCGEENRKFLGCFPNPGLGCPAHSPVRFFFRRGFPALRNLQPASVLVCVTGNAVVPRMSGGFVSLESLPSASPVFRWLGTLPYTLGRVARLRRLGSCSLAVSSPSLRSSGARVCQLALEASVEAAAFCSQLCCSEVSGFCPPVVGFPARARDSRWCSLAGWFAFWPFLGPVWFPSQESKT